MVRVRSNAAADDAPTGSRREWLRCHHSASVMVCGVDAKRCVFSVAVLLLQRVSSTSPTARLPQRVSSAVPVSDGQRRRAANASLPSQGSRAPNASLPIRVSVNGQRPTRRARCDVPCVWSARGGGVFTAKVLDLPAPNDILISMEGEAMHPQLELRHAASHGAVSTTRFASDIPLPYFSLARRGDAATTWIVRGRVAATPRLPRESSVGGVAATSRPSRADRPWAGRGDVAAVAWMVRGALWMVRGALRIIRGALRIVRGAPWIVRGALWMVRGALWIVRGALWSCR